jgi:non-homologous end joining protein Ku
MRYSGTHPVKTAGTGQEVATDDIIKGYEVSNGPYVEITS